MTMMTSAHLGWGNCVSRLVDCLAADCRSLSFQLEAKNSQLSVDVFSFAGYLEDGSQPFHTSRGIRGSKLFSKLRN